MNSNSLENQVRRLKQYLKKVNQLEKANQINTFKQKIISHTLIGMILVINNLIVSGCYSQDDNNDELYKLIEQARHTAIHYGFFNDYKHIYPSAKKIAELSASALKNNFAEKLKNLKIDKTESYFLLKPQNKTEIKKVENSNLYSFREGKEEIFIDSNDLIEVTSEIDKHSSYLIRNTNEQIFFYKASKDSTTTKIDYKFIKSNTIFKNFFYTNEPHFLFDIFKRLYKEIEDDNYQIKYVSYYYDNKKYTKSIHNIFREFLYQRTLDSRIFNNNYGIESLELNYELKLLEINKNQMIEIAKRINNQDIFFIELFLKRYNKDINNMFDHLPASELKRVNTNIYTKLSLLINLYENGLAYITDNFIKLNSTFKDYFYNYRNLRNVLAHTPITDGRKLNKLIKIFELYNKELYQFFSNVYSIYNLNKTDFPSNCSSVKKIKNAYMINNQTSKYFVLEHQGNPIIIDNKKYLNLYDNIYLSIDNTYYSFDCNMLTSNEIIVPIDNTNRLIQINPTTNRISNAHAKVNKERVVYVDKQFQTLLQAHDYLKVFPQLKKGKSPLIHFKAITYFDNEGKPTFTENLTDVIYRRYSQKILPSYLLEASNLVIPFNHDIPIQVLNRNNKLVAKIYLAHINEYDNEQILQQILTDGTQKDIEYGKLLPKDLETTSITEARKKDCL